MALWSCVLAVTQRYLKDFNALYENMKSSDVALFGVTAQPQVDADKAVTQLGLHFKTYGDPDHNLAKYLKEKGLLEVIITRRSDSKHPKVKDYKDGMVQPGIL